jgi:TP901 family phage tail tape measure protein
MANRTFSIFAKFKAIDQLTEPVKKMNEQVKKLNSSMSKAGKIGARIEKFGASVKRGFTAAAASVVGFGFGVNSVVKAAADFEHALVEAGGNFPHETILKGTKEFEDLGNSVVKFAEKTEFSSTTAAKALVLLSKAQFTSKQALAALVPISDLASAGTIDLAEAAKFSADILTTLNLKVKDSIQLQKNLRLVTDQLVVASDLSTASLTEQAMALRDAAPQGRQQNQSLATTLTLLSSISGVARGAEAGTAFRNIAQGFIGAQKGTATFNKIVNQLGINLNKLSGEGPRDALDIIEDIQKAIREGRIQASEASLFAGQAASTALSVILSTDIRLLRQMREQIENSGGASVKLANIMRQTLTVRMQQLGAAIDNIKIGIFSESVDETSFAFDKLLINIKSMTPAITKLGGIVFRFLGDHIQGILTFAAAWTALLASIHVIRTISIVGAFFGLELALAPITAIGAAITGIVVGLKWIFDHSSQISEAFSNVSAKVFTPGQREFLGQAGESIGSFISGRLPQVDDIFTRVMNQEKVEVTIKDETGRAEIKASPGVSTVSVPMTGGM